MQKYKPFYQAGQIVETIDGYKKTLAKYLHVEAGQIEVWLDRNEEEIRVNAKRKFTRKSFSFVLAFALFLIVPNVQAGGVQAEHARQIASKLHNIDGKLAGLKAQNVTLERIAAALEALAANSAKANHCSRCCPVDKSLNSNGAK